MSVWVSSGFFVGFRLEHRMWVLISMNCKYVGDNFLNSTVAGPLPRTPVRATTLPLKSHRTQITNHKIWYANILIYLCTCFVYAFVTPKSSLDLWDLQHWSKLVGLVQSPSTIMPMNLTSKNKSRSKQQAWFPAFQF